MNKLNALERTLLTGLIEKYPNLQAHVDLLKVASRKSTGTGLIVTFEYDNSDIVLDEISALFSNEENIVLPKLKKGLSYVFDITAGKIEYLEFTTYEEKWDGVIGDYKLVEKTIYPEK